MTLVTTSKSRTLSGITDLTLLAPVRRGLIDALDTRTYASRARLVMQTLNSLRLSSREAEPTRLVTDVVDRVQAIHSFRVMLVEEEPRRILLNVVFDGGWEPYMRRIWRDLGPLLDVVFCNCENYLLSTRSTFASYAAWVRSVQIDTQFFYTAAPVTVGDLHYLRRREHQRLTGRLPDPTPVAGSLEDLLEEAMPALVALYRLSDMHLSDASPDEGDGGCLRRAAQRLLGWLEGGLQDDRFADARQTAIGGRSGSERAALEWFYREPLRPTAAEEAASSAGNTPSSAWTPARVQGGIVEPYRAITHGGLLLLSLRDAAAAEALLADLLAGRRILSAADRRSPFERPPEPYHNLAFTLRGLQVAGVPDGSLGALPAEFREGMAARAGILGDVGASHPMNWRLPRAEWLGPLGAAHGLPVELSSVHAVVQIQLAGTPSDQWLELSDARHPLHATVDAFARRLQDKGVRVLAVQTLQRFPDPHGRQVDAFGFVDGISQPRLEPVAADDPDRVATGDLLLGYPNSLGDLPSLRGRLWDDGSFLVLRKLRQDVDAFDTNVPQEADRARLLGRWPDGSLRLGHPEQTVTGNAFDFSADPDGQQCPFASHVRRANPRRLSAPDLRSIPRILRRGMAWGPRTGGERGLVFMAYNASIAEQFEVIQGWLARGSSGASGNDHRTVAGLPSSQRDPLLGVPLPGEARAFDNGDGTAIKLPDRPLATLEWGLYLFVPSMPALGELRTVAAETARLESAPDEGQDADLRARRRRDARSVLTAHGAALIARLRRAEQEQPLEMARELWKTALEDLISRMSGASRAIWAAVADVHGGALRTPFGVLVARRDLVRQVLADDGRQTTVSGYNDRLSQSFGPIHLGLDGTDADYRRQAGPVDDAIMAIGLTQAFDAAYYRARQAVVTAVDGLGEGESRRVEVRDLVDAVLADLCRDWFGIPDDAAVLAGGWHGRAQATCPGHFAAPSRMTFQPQPGSEAVRVGREHGQTLLRAVRNWLPTQPSDGRPILKAIRGVFQDLPGDLQRQATTLIGVMMGFLPTVDGNLRGVLWEWVEDRQLWTLQSDLLAAPLDPGDTVAVRERAEAVLGLPLARTLHLRPVPEMVWRTVTSAHAVGGVPVQPGDRLVAGLVGALQEGLDADELDLSLLFGGHRGGSFMADEQGLEAMLKPGAAAPHPTHACPGVRMAWGVMLGFLAGLLTSARLRPTLSSMSLRLGPLQGVAAAGPAAPAVAPAEAATAASSTASTTAL